MKEIPLGQSGFFAKVDDEDFRWLSLFPWRLQVSGMGQMTAAFGRRISGKMTMFLMHRMILGITNSKVQVDHINGDSLDNRRTNLRICNNQQNNFNKGRRKDNTSGSTGVRWHKQAQKWHARISLNGRETSLGLFDSKEDAIAARLDAVIQHHGDFAHIEN